MSPLVGQVVMGTLAGLILALGLYRLARYAALPPAFSAPTPPRLVSLVMDVDVDGNGLLCLRVNGQLLTALPREVSRGLAVQVLAAQDGPGRDAS